LSEKKFYNQLVLVSGEFFCLAWESESRDFGFTILQVALKEISETFKYGIKIGNSEEYVAATRECHNYWDVNLMGLQRRKGVAISYDTVLDFVSESGSLTCEIEIGREKLDGFVLEERQEHLPFVYVVGSELD